jgi:hypothetical protein
VVFLDNLGREFLHVDNVYIAAKPNTELHRLSPSEFDVGHFMFDTMLDLTTSPPSCSNTTIWCRVPAYIIPNGDNRLHDFIAPPRDMLDFNLVVAIHCP